MKNLGKVRSSFKPPEIEITATSVFVASNITQISENIDGQTIQEYEYDYAEYTKDEYIVQNAKAISDLESELKAAKIILGVE